MKRTRQISSDSEPYSQQQDEVVVDKARELQKELEQQKTESVRTDMVKFQATLDSIEQKLRVAELEKQVEKDDLDKLVATKVAEATGNLEEKLHKMEKKIAELEGKSKLHAQQQQQQQQQQLIEASVVKAIGQLREELVKTLQESQQKFINEQQQEEKLTQKDKQQINAQLAQIKKGMDEKLNELKGKMAGLGKHVLENFQKFEKKMETQQRKSVGQMMDKHSGSNDLLSESQQRVMEQYELKMAEEQSKHSFELEKMTKKLEEAMVEFAGKIASMEGQVNEMQSKQNDFEKQLIGIGMQKTKKKMGNAVGAATDPRTAKFSQQQQPTIVGHLSGSSSSNRQINQWKANRWDADKLSPETKLSAENPLIATKEKSLKPMNPCFAHVRAHFPYSATSSPANCTARIGNYYLLFYYEVQLKHQRNNLPNFHFSIGWIGENFPFLDDKALVGRNTSSYGLDESGCYREDRKKSAAHFDGFGVNDVVGCGLLVPTQPTNGGTRKLFFTKNGQLNRNIFPLPSYCSEDPLYPAFSFFNVGTTVEGNFGAKPFIFDVNTLKSAF